MKYNYIPSSSRFASCEAFLLKGKLSFYNDEPALYIIRNNSGDWGDAKDFVTNAKEESPLPSSLEMRWITSDNRCYAIKTSLDESKAALEWKKQTEKHPEDEYVYYVVGTAPFGWIAIWLRSEKKSVLLYWMKAGETILEEYEKKRFGKNIIFDKQPLSVTQEQIESWMCQYEYRFISLEDYWDGGQWKEYDVYDLYYDDIDLYALQVRRFDGTHDQTNDFSLLDYHKAGIPKSIVVKWHEGQADFSAFYWFDEHLAPQTMHHFFIKNALIRADILLRIDTRANQYEIALKGELLVKPQVFPKEAYQLLVFMNGNEYYRSENYAQEDSAWNW